MTMPFTTSSMDDVTQHFPQGGSPSGGLPLFQARLSNPLALGTPPLGNLLPFSATGREGREGSFSSNGLSPMAQLSPPHVGRHHSFAAGATKDSMFSAAAVGALPPAFPKSQGMGGRRGSLHSVMSSRNISPSAHMFTSVPGGGGGNPQTTQSFGAASSPLASGHQSVCSSVTNAPLSLAINSHSPAWEQLHAAANPTGTALAQVIPGALFLGGNADLHENPDGVRAANVSAFLCVAANVVGLPTYVSEADVAAGRIAFKHMPLADSGATRLEDHLPEAFASIDAARAEGRAVVVYCQAGKSRSVSIVAACLMREERTTFAETIQYIRMTRPVADPNINFCMQLQALERSPLIGLAGRQRAQLDGDGDGEIVSVPTSPCRSFLGLHKPSASWSALPKPLPALTATGGLWGGGSDIDDGDEETSASVTLAPRTAGEESGETTVDSGDSDLLASGQSASRSPPVWPPLDEA